MPEKAPRTRARRPAADTNGASVAHRETQVPHLRAWPRSRPPLSAPVRSPRNQPSAWHLFPGYGGESATRPRRPAPRVWDPGRGGSGEVGPTATNVRRNCSGTATRPAVALPRRMLCANSAGFLRLDAPDVAEASPSPSRPPLAGREIRRRELPGRRRRRRPAFPARRATAPSGPPLPAVLVRRAPAGPPPGARLRRTRTVSPLPPWGAPGGVQASVARCALRPTLAQWRRARRRLPGSDSTSRSAVSAGAGHVTEGSRSALAAL